jgi:hypothetical protein
LRWLRRGERKTDPTPVALDPIRIATPEFELVGFVASTGQRVTDMLLRGQDLAFLPQGADPEPDNWVSVSTSDILFVIPPPLPPRPGWQPRPQMRKVLVRVGPYRIIGSANLPAASELDGELKARSPFLPLTSASILRDGEAEPRDVEVAIVNLGMSTEHRLVPDGEA